MTVSRVEISLKNELPEIHRLADEVEAFFSAHAVPMKLVYNFNLALDEIITNIVSYGYEDGGEHRIIVRLAVDGSLVEAEVIDDAKAFDPLSAKEPDILAELDDRPIGGLGMFFVKTLMDEVRYKREGDRNHLFLSKRAEPGGTQDVGG
jgi:anti-sigma regulatory factor (Ser/Thr protein kinase)